MSRQKRNDRFRTSRFPGPVAEPIERRIYLSGLAGTGTTVQAIANQSLDIGDIDGGGAVYVAPGVSVTVDSINEYSLTVGGNLTIATTGLTNQSRNSLVALLNLTPQAGVTGTLDLTDNVLYIDYEGNADPISQIASEIASGFNGGAWNGPGIISSTAAYSAYALGYADGNDGVVQNLPQGMIEIMYTLIGDADLNGAVNGGDFTILASHFNHSVTNGWDQGDFNYDGYVNASDYLALLSNFNNASLVSPAPNYTIPPQYIATFTDTATTPLNLLTATINWGDGSAPTPGAIVSDGNGTFHVIANHTFANPGVYQVTTTINDGNANTSTTVESSAIVSATPFAAEPLDAGDIQLTWSALPILGAGAVLQYSTDPTFSTGVTSLNLAAGVTSQTISGLAPSTTYYFQLEPTTTGPIVAATSATTDPSDGNGGTAGPTAPTITQQATSSQPTNTTLTLTMTAASGSDPISYSWQEISGPGGPPPELTNSEQTTDVILGAAGTYEFQGTATEDSTGLSISSDVNATVNQVATSISLSPSPAQLTINGKAQTLQFSAIENDQFGRAMTSQPAFSWSIANSAMGAIDSTGLFSYDWSEYYSAGITTIHASADGIDGATTLTLLGYSPQTVDFSSLPDGTNVTTQFAGVAFSVSGGDGNATTDSNLTSALSFYYPSWLVVPPGSSQPTLTINFSNLVNFVYFLIGSNSQSLGSGFEGTVNAYANNTLVDSQPYTAFGPTGFIYSASGTSATENTSSPGITSIQITPSSDFTGGIAISNIEYTPVVPSIYLGNNSPNQVMQASNGGNQNLVPLSLYVPDDLFYGTQVTLSTSASSEVDVWNSANPTSGSTPLLGGSAQTNSTSWIFGTDLIPSTLYVGATAGSQTVGDITFTLAITAPGQSTPAAQATTQSATAVQINSLTVSDANNPSNTVTSTDNSDSASVVALADQSNGEASINLSVNVTPQSLVGQQNMLWEVVDQSTGEVVNAGTFSNGNFEGLTLKPTAPDDSTYIIKVGFVQPGQTTLQPNQVTQSITLYVVTTDPYFEIGGVADEDSGNTMIQKFYDPNPNAMSEELSGIANIDWGDGSQSSGTIQSIGNGVYAVMGDHTYDEGSDYSVNINISTLSSSSSSSSSSNDRQMTPPQVSTPIYTLPYIYVVNDPTAAHNHGHSALLVPDATGCLYLTYDNSNKVTQIQYNNPTEALAAAKACGYTRSEAWNCTVAQGQDAIATALNNYDNTDYNVRNHNCWDMCFDALQAAGAKVQMFPSSAGIDEPNDNFVANEKTAAAVKDPL